MSKIKKVPKDIGSTRPDEWEFFDLVGAIDENDQPVMIQRLEGRFTEERLSTMASILQVQIEELEEKLDLITVEKDKNK